MYNSFCTKVNRKKMAQGVNFFQNFWVQFSYVRKFYFGTGVMWPHWIVLQHAVITDVRRSILHYLPNTPSNSSCPHYGGAPNYHQGPWSHKLQKFSRIQNGLSGCSDLVHLQIKEINFALFTFSLYRDIKTYTLFIGEKWSQTCDWGWTVSRAPTLVWYCICKTITWLTGRVVLFWRWTVRKWKEDGGLATT